MIVMTIIVVIRSNAHTSPLCAFLRTARASVPLVGGAALRVAPRLLGAKYSTPEIWISDNN